MYLFLIFKDTHNFEYNYIFGHGHIGYFTMA